MILKDFANERNESAHTIATYIRRHPDLFDGHTGKKGNQLTLDEEAVAILDKIYPLPKLIEVVDNPETEEKLKKALDTIATLTKLLQETKGHLDEANKKAELYDQTQALLGIAELEVEHKEIEVKQLKEELEKLPGLIDKAVTENTAELNDKHRKDTDVLRKHYDDELKERGIMHDQAIKSLNNAHGAAMIAEKNRKLSIGEAIKRVLGIKIVDDSPTIYPEPVSGASDPSEKQSSADENLVNCQEL